MFKKTLVLLLLVVLLSVSFVSSKKDGDVKAKKEAKEVVVEDVVEQADDLEEEQNAQEEVLEEEEEVLEDDEDLAEEDEEADLYAEDEEFEDEESFEDEDEESFEDEDEDFEEADFEEDEDGWEEFIEIEEPVEEVKTENKKNKKQNFDLAGLMQATRTASNYETQAPPDPSQSRTPSFIPPTPSFTPIVDFSQSNTAFSASGTGVPPSSSNTPISQTPTALSNSQTNGLPSPSGTGSQNTLTNTNTQRATNSRTKVPKTPKKPTASDCTIIDNNACNMYKNCYWNVYRQMCLFKPKAI